MRITVRPYRRSDAGDLLGLIRGLARFEKLKPPTPAARRRLIRDAGKRFEVLMVRAGDRAVGYAFYFYTYSSFLGRPTLWLEDLYVDPEYRGSGIGGRVFDRLARKAKREGCGRMEWQVLDWNRKARTFYRKRGARPLSNWITCRLSFR